MDTRFQSVTQACESFPDNRHYATSAGDMNLKVVIMTDNNGNAFILDCVKDATTRPFFWRPMCLR